MSPRLGPLDLLQERRRASGALEPGGPMPPAQGLLLRGAGEPWAGAAELAPF